MAKPKIIIFDLETLPNLPEVLKVWCQLSNYPGLTMKATITSIICAGWKQYGHKKTHCINAWDFKGRWKRNVNDDYSVCKKIYDVLKNADAVVTHNGKRFDWKFLQTRLLYHGLPTLSKIHHIDTCMVARANLFAFNNRLGTLGKLLANDDKLENGGWDLWVQVHGKKKSAMKLMTKYCKQDVNLLEKIFKRLIPLINNMPNRNLFRSQKKIKENTRVCPNCGESKLHFNGWRHTQTQSYQRLRCDSCGSYCRTDVQGNKPRTF